MNDVLYTNSFNIFNFQMIYIDSVEIVGIDVDKSADRAKIFMNSDLYSNSSKLRRISTNTYPVKKQ